MKSIKELNEYCQLRNRSIVVKQGKQIGFRSFDYPVNKRYN